MPRIGFSEADITPGTDTLTVGSYRARKMTGVHDRLLAVACVIESGGSAVALVGVDAGVIMKATADEARHAIERETGIPFGHVIISASHTHQGGPSLSTFHAVADREYAKVVSRGVVEAVRRAWTNRVERQIGDGVGRVAGIHFNRRFVMRDGREATHPGKMNADIVRPAGPVDEAIGVLAARDASEKLVGVVVNFGCHCTVTEDGTEYSADYVHYLREHLKRLLAPVPVVFLLGACGDVTQVDNQRAGREKGHAWADTMGTTLAAEAARCVMRMAWREDVKVAAATETCAVAIREGDVAPAATVGLGAGAEWEEIYAREKTFVAEMRRATPVVECNVTAVRIGELGIVANGAELFCQPALDIKHASPAERTWVVTLANEYLGYVPTSQAHRAGGYEVRTARSSFLEIDAAEKLVAASLVVLRKI